METIINADNNDDTHSCCEAWEELGKGNRCELQASLSGDGGQVQAAGGKTSPKSGGATSMPGGYRPSSTKPQTPAAQPECKLRLVQKVVFQV